MAIADVGIVGAGIAGLACARRLQQAGYTVTVWEKSRGLGGRMATRRLEGMAMDHGARYVQPQGSLLTQLVQQWEAQGLLQQWSPHVYELDSTGQLNPGAIPGPTYCAPAGMAALGKSLAGELTLYKQQRVTAIAPTEEGTWQLTAIAAPEESTHTTPVKALVLAMPAPQSVALLEPLRSHPTVTDLLTHLATVRYAPCITVMAQYAAPMIYEHDPAPLPCAPTAPWMVTGHADTPFFWVGLDSSKRGLAHPNVILQSSAGFAEHWLEVPHPQDAGTALLQQAGKLIAPWLSQPARWQVHRWRYALVEQPCQVRPTAMQTPLPLVACGDWWGDRALDTALESGWAAAEEVNQALDGRSLPAFDPAWLAT